jgi:uncharacterized repeat protein (TIGR01451 family)
VALRDTVPAGVSQVSVASPPGTTCVGGTPGNPADPLACALGNLGPGATAVVTVVVRVAPNLAAGTVLVNQASVVSDTADPNNANNIAGRSVTVQTRADLAITKASDKDTYGPLAHVTWTITVRNNGPSDAQAVTLTDQLPKDLAYMSNTGGCTNADDILTCQFGTVPAGATVTFTMREKTGFVRRPTKVTNTASVASSTTDPVPGNNTAAKDVTVTPL